MRIEAFNDRLITLLSAFAMRPRGQPTSVGQLVYSGCVNDDLKKTNVKVNPIHYHHYPFGDGKWMPGSSGFVGPVKLGITAHIAKAGTTQIPTSAQIANDRDPTGWHKNNITSNKKIYHKY
ncbi:hypothetical protein PGTUg99_033231 [Puccinia graminis f. sp. tritici]|uniref:Uncharacterized protein n=1 Tax=Puccinia graminis f. sp. tritici TaxID=56615 RepID=A0A5B0S194_PUCGR|nr:hypothetical protein PGTUg99_033231 [Puccinia graminis f. sp. tritici]